MNQEELNRQLLEAAEKGDFDRILELVELGADVNASNKYGWTALTLSAWKGHLTTELLNAFISHEADINAQNEDGGTALMYSAWYGKLTPELLDAFMKNGADINARNKDGNTALMVSARNSYLTPELLEAFISHGADIHARDEYGRTALIWSAYYGHLTPEFLGTFISNGADVNARDKDGDSAMSLCLKGHGTVWVRSILSFFSCGYSIRDMYDGWTPESFIKWLKDNKVKNEGRTVYALLAALSLYPERNETLDEILYGRNVGAGLNMVLEMFSSMNESVWLPFVPSLLGAMAGDRKKPLNVKAENAPLMVRILLHCLETEPGAALEFVKQRIGKKNLETWVNHGVEGANTLVSRLVPYLKNMEKKKSEDRKSIRGNVTTKNPNSQETGALEFF